MIRIQAIRNDMYQSSLWFYRLSAGRTKSVEFLRLDTPYWFEGIKFDHTLNKSLLIKSITNNFSMIGSPVVNMIKFTNDKWGFSHSSIISCISTT